MQGGVHVSKIMKPGGFFLSYMLLWLKSIKLERAEVDAVINEVLEDRNELNFNFEDGFNSP
jgi:hypothetical protein